MNLAKTIDRIIPALASTLKRFPIAIIAAVALFLYYNIWEIGYSYGDNWNVVFAACAAFFAAGAGHLVAEGRGSRLPIWAFVFALVAAVLMYFDRWFHTSALFLFGGLLPLLMISPFLHQGVRQGAVWLFNLRLALAIVLALIVGVVFGLGLSAVFAGLDFLFGMTIADNVYERVWTLAIILVGPIYGLSLIPQNLSEEIDLNSHQGSLLERGVSVLVNYVMVPLALVYALILHAYAIKIAFIGELPKGQIGIIVSLFALGGTATWLVGWPWRETGTKLLRLFMRGWFWLLPVPAVLLSLAISRRVSEYGVTPDRYGIALVAVWTALIFVYLVLRKNRADMRTILGSAAVLLLIASFGPLGAFGTTGSSQTSRLQTLLERVGVLKNGQVVAELPKFTDADRDAGNSALNALRTVNDIKRALALLGKNDLSPTLDDYALQDNLATRFGLSAAAQEILRFNFNPDLAADRNWSGKTRVIGPMQITSYGDNLSAATGVDITLSPQEFSVTVDGVASTLKISDLNAKLNAVANSEQDRRIPLFIDISSKLALIVERANGILGDQPQLESMSFWLIIHE